MNTELEEARKAQYEALHIGSQLESDYALLEATQRAIDAQTVECIACDGTGLYQDGEITTFDDLICPTCNGRGRVGKDGV